jgi:hypothetical protein
MKFVHLICLFKIKTIIFKIFFFPNYLNKTSTTNNKKNRRARTTTRKESTSKTNSKKKSASQTISSDTEPLKDIISETSTSKTKKTPTSRNFWSLEDDKKLIDAVLVNLQDVPWSKIARENFPSRDRSGCYNRWNVIKKRLYQDINGNGGDE